MVGAPFNRIMLHDILHKLEAEAGILIEGLTAHKLRLRSAIYMIISGLLVVDLTDCLV